MNDLHNALFGLRSMGFGEESVQFGFAPPIPAWGWLLALIIAGGLAGWSYWRLAGPAWSRGVLATLRALVLLLILVLIAGPQLIRPNERVEKDWVLVLADRSASMAIADLPGNAARRTREEQFRAALAEGWPGLS